MRFLVAYDIADPRRLRRVARFMERWAVRAQKSVFLFHGDQAAVARLLDGVAPLLNAAEDYVQAWLLGKRQPGIAMARGTGPILYPAAVVLCGTGAAFVQARGAGQAEDE